MYPNLAGCERSMFLASAPDSRSPENRRCISTELVLGLYKASAELVLS